MPKICKHRSVPTKHIALCAVHLQVSATCKCTAKKGFQFYSVLPILATVFKNGNILRLLSEKHILLHRIRLEKSCKHEKFFISSTCLHIELMQIR